jgi:hypothetical protein
MYFSGCVGRTVCAEHHCPVANESGTKVCLYVWSWMVTVTIMEKAYDDMIHDVLPQTHPAAEPCGSCCLLSADIQLFIRVRVTHVPVDEWEDAGF